MTVLWPASLPQTFLSSGFGQTAAANSVSFQPELGPPMDRRRGTSAPESVTAAINLTLEQWQVFDAFFRDTLRAGTVNFRHVHPLRPGTVTMRFAAPPQTAAMGGDVYRVSMQLMILA